VTDMNFQQNPCNWR